MTNTNDIDAMIEKLMDPVKRVMIRRVKQILREAVLASTPGDWIVHVLGPDDIISQPDEITALRQANIINKAFWKMPRNENDPIIVAIVKNKQTDSL
jgi:hypothetical protein